jgi:tungstate transport system permease protein
LPDQWGAADAANLAAIVALSLEVSLGATVIAALIGIPLGTVIAIRAFPGRHLLILVINALLGLPPVVVGLALYLVLSHAGPLGWAGMLFTPGAMIAAQTVLATPIVTALVHRATQGPWQEYGSALQVDGVSTLGAIPVLVAIARLPVLTAVLAGFGRAVSEVGAILIVGGNIAGYTRTMTTTVALETSKGNLTLALELGMILIGISIAVSAVGYVLGERKP